MPASGRKEIAAAKEREVWRTKYSIKKPEPDMFEDRYD
jgi:hypothetical protein